MTNKQQTTYKVPIARKDQNDEKDLYFNEYLSRQVNIADQHHFQYREKQRYYDEDYQKKMSDLRDFLESKPMSIARKRGIQFDSNIHFISLILGRMVKYTTKKYELESLYIERGKNKNILNISGSNPDLAYTKRLLVENLRHLLSFQGYEHLNHVYHSVLSLNPVVNTLYPNDQFEVDLGLRPQEFTKENIAKQEEVLKNDPYQLELYLQRVEAVEEHVSSLIEYFYNSKDFDVVGSEYEFRKGIIDDINKATSGYDFIKLRIIRFANQSEDQVDWKLDIVNFESLEETEQSMLEHIEANDDYYGFDLMFYYRNKFKKIPLNLIFSPAIIWVDGIETFGYSLPPWLENVASNSLDVNMLFVFTSNDEVDVSVANACNYIFISGNSQKLYDRYYMDNPPKNPNGVKANCYIKNLNKRFSFKKYLVDFDSHVKSSIDLDELFRMVEEFE